MLIFSMVGVLQNDPEEHLLIRFHKCMGGACGKSLQKKLQTVNIPHHHGNIA